jgi:hypothetical protein
MFGGGSGAPSLASGSDAVAAMSISMSVSLALVLGPASKLIHLGFLTLHFYSYCFFFVL